MNMFIICDVPLSWIRPLQLSFLFLGFFPFRQETSDGMNGYHANYFGSLSRHKLQIFNSSLVNIHFTDYMNRSLVQQAKDIDLACST